MVFLFVYCTCCSGIPCSCRDRLHICVCYAREGKLLIAWRDWELAWLDTKLGDPRTIWDAIEARLALGLATTLKACRVEVGCTSHPGCTEPQPPFSALTSPASDNRPTDLPPGCFRWLLPVTEKRGCSGQWTAGKCPWSETDPIKQMRCFSCRLCCHLDPIASQPHPCPVTPVAPMSPVRVREFASLSIPWQRCMSSSYSDWWCSR